MTSAFGIEHLAKARIDTSAYRAAHMGDELGAVDRWVHARMPGVKRNEIVRVSSNGLGGVVTPAHQAPKSRVRYKVRRVFPRGKTPPRQ